MSRRVLAFSVVAILGAFAAFGIWSPGGVSEVEAAPVIGENSCEGVGACVILEDGIVIGDNSCNGENSCVIVENGAVIGDNSCNGQEACVIVDDGTIGDGSCNGRESCVIVDDGTIGDGSCSRQESCVIVEPGGSVGNGSCNAGDSCVIVSGTVGDGSCNGVGACVIVDGVVGANSCQGIQACIIVQPSGSVGDNSCFTPGSCLIVSDDLGDCFENPGCLIELTKTAAPDMADASGGTVVAYRIRVEVLEDVFVNSIVDSEYMLDVERQCSITGASGQDLPGLFPAGSGIVCDYAYPLPSGPVGTTYDNVVTVNVGEECEIFLPGVAATGVEGLVRQRIPDREDLPEAFLGFDLNIQAEPCAIAGGAGELTTSAITPGEQPGTVDVTAEASVLYVAQVRRPNIGAGLSGLFAGQPTPLPTAPGAVAPAATAPTISPPRTGDGGLAGGAGANAAALGSLVVVSAALIVGLRIRATR